MGVHFAHFFSFNAGNTVIGITGYTGKVRVRKRARAEEGYTGALRFWGTPDLKPELIICCGDTITHLANKEQIEQLIADASNILTDNGKLILTFRDYSTELNDQQRFIPVKSTTKRILTCILEYGTEKLKVTDLLHEKVNGEWTQKVSSYEKVRISSNEVVDLLKKYGMDTEFNQPINRMHTIIAKKNGLQ